MVKFGSKPSFIGWFPIFSEHDPFIDDIPSITSIHTFIYWMAMGNHPINEGVNGCEYHL